MTDPEFSERLRELAERQGLEEVKVPIKPVSDDVLYCLVGNLKFELASRGKDVVRLVLLDKALSEAEKNLRPEDFDMIKKTLHSIGIMK